MTVPYIKFTTCEKIQLDTHFKKVKMASVLLLFEVLIETQVCLKHCGLDS